MMTTWRYTAIPAKGHSVTQSGEIAAESAERARAALRRIDLQVTHIRRAWRPHEIFRGVGLNRIHDRLCRYLCERRRGGKSELFDSLSTMLDAGVPLLDALDSMNRSGSRRSPMTRMTGDLRETIREGESLSAAMCGCPSWFDATDVAMVGAAQVAGELPRVLASVAERHSRSSELQNKLVASLTYPFLVSLVGVGVSVFLSVKTLPELVGILTGAGVDPPRLTVAVMSTGQVLVGSWWAIPVLAIALFSVGAALRARFESVLAPPRLMRQLLVARFLTTLTDLLRAGVPLVDSLRVVTPTISGWGSHALRSIVVESADRIERGSDVVDAFDAPRWFDAEFQRLVSVADSAGDLDQALERIGTRYQRRAERLIDRLATLLEPAAIIILAAFVGIVVLAAVLPLVRMQEIL